MSELTAQQAIKYVEHALGGSLSSQIAPTDIINMAGEHLVSFHPWNWLRGATGTISFTADQAYAALPTDFQALVAIDKTASVIDSFHLTTVVKLLALRTSQLGSPAFGTYGSIVFTGTPPVARMELWPTPTASATDVVTLYYRRGWTEPSLDTTALAIPTWCRDLYLSMCVAYALGFEESENGSLGRRLAEIDNGPICMAAKRRDGMAQHTFGQIEGGAVQAQFGRPNPYQVSSVSGP